MDLADRKKALQAVLAALDKEEGEGSAYIYGDGPIIQLPVIPTGSLSLDIALGVGGIPKGRIIEAYGPEGSGKTTLGLHVVAEAQRQGELAAYIDMEHSLDLQYARNIGVDTDDLVLSQPMSGDSGMRILDKLTRSGTVSIIIVDSVSALVPIEELEGAITDSHVGRQARMMSQALRILAGRANMTGTTIYFINQLRMKIGVMFGNPETTSGGNALKFYSTIRMDVRRKAQIKTGEDVEGARTKVRVVKNKVAPPFKNAEFDIIFGEGIDSMGDILDLGPEYGIIDKSGAWFSYNGERLGQGKKNARLFLTQQPELADQLKNDLKRLALPERYSDEATEDEQPNSSA